MTIDSDSSIPPNIAFGTLQELSIFEVCTDDMIMVIKLLDPNKAHGH